MTDWCHTGSLTSHHELPNFVQKSSCLVLFFIRFATYLILLKMKKNSLNITFIQIKSYFMDLVDKKDILFFGQYHKKSTIVRPLSEQGILDGK
jgi:hypothetical protein